MRFFVQCVLITGLLFSLAGCANEVGTLEFRANGEDFVRNGFVTKDGWQIDFDTVDVTVTDVKAYRTDGGYDATYGDTPEGLVAEVDGVYTIDLAAGDENADPILVASAETEVGHYDAISWAMVNGDDGNTLRLVGIAEKAEETVRFDIKIDESYAYTCGEFVGDERTGFVKVDAADDVEMTFHFDHVFGDSETPADDDLNVGAVGFEPLSALAVDGVLDVTMADFQAGLSAENYDKLTDMLATLGHVGEGHCYEATNGYTDSEG